MVSHNVYSIAFESRSKVKIERDSVKPTKFQNWGQKLIRAKRLKLIMEFNFSPSTTFNQE